jgi:phage tail sheath protein FI
VPEYLTPGVFVEEVSFRAKSIEGVGTSTTAFVGPTRKGPLNELPELVTSFGEFERVYGGVENLSFAAGSDTFPQTTNYLAHAVRAYFDNGGSRLYVARVFQPRTDAAGAVISDGVARSPSFVNVAAGQARFVARAPGAGLNVAVIASERVSPASRATMDAALEGSLLRVGGSNPALGASLVGGRPPFMLNNGDQLVINLHDGPITITFQGGPAEARSEPVADPAAVSIPADSELVVTMGGLTQRIALPAGDQTLEDLADAINARVRRGYARLDGGNRLVIGSDIRGNSARVDVATFAPLGFANAVTALGSGNVPDLDAVSAADIGNLLPVGAPIQLNLSPTTGLLTLITAETGGTATLAITDNASRTALGLPNASASGLAGTPVVSYRKVAGSWIGGADRRTRLDGVPADAQLVGLTLRIVDAGGDERVYDNLGFDPAHPRFVGEVLKEHPTRRADSLSQPIFIDIDDAIDAFDLHAGLVGATGSNTLALSGGNDGFEPQAEADGLAGAWPYRSALELLEGINDIAIIAAPGHSSFEEINFQAIQEQLYGHAERMRYRIAVLDARQGQILGEIREQRSRIDSTRAALYYPWVMVANPLARPGNERIPRELALPPSGFMAGIYARTDVNRGVWKAPANEVVRGALRFEREINDAQQAVLNPEGINCLRSFYGQGNKVWGARTTSSDPEWKYVNVRRYFIYLEHSIDRSTQWAVFEPNGEQLWANITEAVSAFLFNEWRSGALLGSKPEAAFFVRCGRSTMTQNDLDNGRLICLIGVAPLKPAEFVIFRIGQMTADARS